MAAAQRHPFRRLSRSSVGFLPVRTPQQTVLYSTSSQGIRLCHYYCVSYRRLCDYLHLPSDRVLIHWACTKVGQSSLRVSGCPVGRNYCTVKSTTAQDCPTLVDHSVA